MSRRRPAHKAKSIHAQHYVWNKADLLSQKKAGWWVMARNFEKNKTTRWGGMGTFEAIAFTNDSGIWLLGRQGELKTLSIDHVRRFVMAIKHWCFPKPSRRDGDVFCIFWSETAHRSAKLIRNCWVAVGADSSSQWISFERLTNWLARWMRSLTNKQNPLR